MLERIMTVVDLFASYPMIRKYTTTSDPPTSDAESNLGFPDQNIYISKRLNRILYLVDVVVFVILLSIVIAMLPVYIPLKLAQQNKSDSL